MKNLLFIIGIIVFLAILAYKCLSMYCEHEDKRVNTEICVDRMLGFLPNGKQNEKPCCLQEAFKIMRMKIKTSVCKCENILTVPVYRDMQGFDLCAQ